LIDRNRLIDFAPLKNAWILIVVLSVAHSRTVSASQEKKQQNAQGIKRRVVAKRRVFDLRKKQNWQRTGKTVLIVKVKGKRTYGVLP
jgi:hypothetical protein